MIRNRSFRAKFRQLLWLSVASAFGIVGNLHADTRPSVGMLRFPDVSSDKITFVYADDIWIVSRDGGLASPLASPPGQEVFPRFSPDGKSIAYGGNYDKGYDLYTISVDGGVPTQITHHPANELLSDWTNSGELVFSTNGLAGLQRQSQIFTVSAANPLPKALPIPYGTNGAISEDGTWLAYTPHSTDNRTWKRYRGGMATDVWLFNLKTNESKQITDFEGTDTLPMWHGKTVYYLSDAGAEHRLNIWSYNTVNGERKQVTTFQDYDCKWPSIGPGPAGKGEIVLQNGSKLYLIDLETSQAKSVDIQIPGERPTIAPQVIDASEYVDSVDLSPNAKRVVIGARGDLWSVPVSKGPTYNLTASSGIAERDPSWSPDGKWISYLSDATGEYELYIRPSNGKGDAQQLTTDGKVWRYGPSWSPDSKRITFSDKTGAIWIYTIESKELKQIDRDPSASPITLNWSHNSQWIAFSRIPSDAEKNSVVWLYNTVDGTRRPITSGFFSDNRVTFDRKGDFLYFSSNRNFTRPQYEDLGESFIYAGTEVIVAVPLRKDVKHPFLATSDEEAVDVTSTEAKAAPDAAKPTEAKPEEKTTPSTFNIDFDDIERRAFVLPIPFGNFGPLAVNDKNELIFSQYPPRGAEGEPSIGIFNLSDEKRVPKTVVKGTNQFGITPDGKKLLVSIGPKQWFVIDAAADQTPNKPIPIDSLDATIDPRAEWKQVFTDAWRIERDFFYDPTMHSVDWNAVRKQYEAMLADCASRRDVGFVIAEMISELNVGHAYYQPGATDPPTPSNVGLLGCRFTVENGAYKVAELFEGAVWDVDARNPLREAGVNVGQYILAVNGVKLAADKDPYAAFAGQAGKTVALTISDDATADANDKQIFVKAISDDSNLRFRAWIEHNRKYVADKTNGKVGYIYVVNTGVPGQNDLVRQFYGQLDKEALIVDDRWNGGGQIPTRFIEMLNRPVTNYWARRDGTDMTWPPDSHQGPKCMLINGLAGSGGDMFPALFRQNGLGKLIGTRTWGGLVGISGNPSMIDGSTVTAPTFAYYEKDGTWGIEGHGVDPDQVVIDDPAKMVNGSDPQLDAAIEHMLAEVNTRGYKKPARPAYPDRSKFGIKPEDK